MDYLAFDSKYLSVKLVVLLFGASRLITLRSATLRKRPPDHAARRPEKLKLDMLCDYVGTYSHRQLLGSGTIKSIFLTR